MAVSRPTPKCSYCGKDTATGRYKNEIGIPHFMRIIGDTFLGWDYKECNCKGATKARKEQKKWNKEHPLDIGKLIKEKEDKIARRNKNES